MGLRWYEHKATSMFMTSGKCRGHLDSLVHRGWADIWHLPLQSLNQVCSRACRAPGQQDRCRSKSSRGRVLAVRVTLVSGLFSNGGASSHPSWWTAESGCSGKCMLSMPRHGAAIPENVKCSDSTFLHWWCEMWATDRPGAAGLGKHVQSHPGQALPCRSSVTIRCLFWLRFLTWIVPPRHHWKRANLVYLVWFFFEREIERKKEKLEENILKFNVEMQGW